MTNPYLAKLHGLMGAQGGQNPKIGQPSKPGFDGFEGDRRSPFFESEGGSQEPKLCKSDGTKGSENAPGGNPQNRQNLPRYARVFAALRERCPEHVEPNRWQQAVTDGQHFLVEWGERAEALGWTARDLFGLHEVPASPAPSYQRLSRYDETGLVWLLQRSPVVALTEATAAIKVRTGSVLTYRRFNKPAYGPLGDSTDDFLAWKAD